MQAGSLMAAVHAWRHTRHASPFGAFAVRCACAVGSTRISRWQGLQARMAELEAELRAAQAEKEQILDAVFRFGCDRAV